MFSLKQPFVEGSVHLNVALQVPTILQRNESLTTETLKNQPYCFEWQESESERDSLHRKGTDGCMSFM